MWKRQLGKDGMASHTETVKRFNTFHDAAEEPTQAAEIEMIEPCEEEDDCPKPRRKKKGKRGVDEDSECEDDEVTFETANT